MIETATNRQLLREFKSLKEKLMNGEISEIHIPQKDSDKIVKITVEKAKTPFERQLERLKKYGPLKIERIEADLFDYLD